MKEPAGLDAALSPAGDLAPLLRKLPAPWALVGLGSGLMSLAVYWWITVAAWWLPLLWLAGFVSFPAFGLGAAALVLGVVKLRYRSRILAWRPAALDEAARGVAARIEPLLQETPAGLAVSTLAEKLALGQDEVVLGLGHLDREGRLDELLDERTGEFRYTLLGVARPNDPASHVSLGQRLAAVEYRRGGERR